MEKKGAEDSILDCCIVSKAVIMTGVLYSRCSGDGDDDGHRAHMN
jgi:hypothetical protein